jgi:hypothetical protein
MVIVACHEIYVAFMDMPAKATGFQRQPTKVFVSAQRKKSLSPPLFSASSATAPPHALIDASSRRHAPLDRNFTHHPPQDPRVTTLPSPTATVADSVAGESNDRVDRSRREELGARLLSVKP